MADVAQVIQIISVRADSLKANRNLFTVLFTIESAILTIILEHFISVFTELVVTVFLLILTLVLMLLGIFTLTDSIHFYSKYVEYRYAWHEKVHGEAYKDKTSEEKAIESFKRALEADDIGYYYLKLSVLIFLWSLASFMLILKILNFYYRIGLFLIIVGILTVAMVNTYKSTHHRKSFKEAFRYFFKRKPVFDAHGK